MWRKLLGGSGLRSWNSCGARSRRSHGFARTRFGRPLRYAEALETRHLLATVALVTETTPSKGIVVTEPIFDELGLDWTAGTPPANDLDWIVSPVGRANGIGMPAVTAADKYFPYAGIDSRAMQGVTPAAYLRIPFTASNVASIETLTLKMRLDDGFIAYLNGVVVASANVPAGIPAWNARATGGAEASSAFTTYDISNHLSALTDGQNVLAVRGLNLIASQGDFLIQAALDASTPDLPLEAVDDTVKFPSTQPSATINVLANDIGGSSGLNPVSVEVVGQASHGTTSVNPTTGAITYTPAAGFSGRDTFTYRVSDNSPEPTPGGNVIQTTVVSTSASHNRLVPTAANAALGMTWTGALANEPFLLTGWTSASGGVGYDNAVAVDFTPFIGDNVGTAMFNVNGSVYMRIPFNLTNPLAVNGFRLRMRNDDGFIAYINGVQVASIRAPAAPTWNSLSTAGVPADADAIVQQEFVIPITGLALRIGHNNNILAIHGLNTAIDSSDLLAQAELIAENGTTGVWSNAATVTVNVQGPGPFTADDIAVTQVHRPVTVAVLDNDTIGTSGAAIRPETVMVTLPPANGIATVETVTGNITYTPHAGFSGVDVFTYTVRDAASASGTSTVDLIPSVAVWKYLDTGVDQGTAWTGRTFNDAAWLSGAAELGYGDGDEATAVGFGGVPENKHITTYFRRAFDLADPAAVQSLTMTLEYDDGAVVYVNGTEVARAGMPAGTVGFATLAAESIEDRQTTIVLTQAQRALLRTGSNVIAVEIHQAVANSTDLSFNLRLQANLLTGTGNISNPATVTVTVVPSDDPPIAVHDEVSVKYGRATVIPVLANDLLGGGLFDLTSVEIVAPPVHGSVEVQSDGSIVYLPDPMYLGEDSFMYTVRDTAGRTSNTGPVSILVTNDAPIAAADAYSVEEDDVLILLAANGLLANDVDDGISPLLLTAVEPPTSGSLLLAADGSFQYTPNPDFAGVDTFRYRVTDELGTTAEAMVTVQVIATADAPVAIDDTYSTTVNTPLLLGMALPTPTTFVAAGAIWRYFDDGVDWGITWREPGFDDETWKFGGGPLGYGNGTETTLVEFGGDPVDRHITTYFRHAFDAADAARVQSLTLGLLRDDGAAVFLNGVEIARSNLPAGATYATLATQAAVGDDETTFVPFAIPAGVMVDGANVLAVEVHQSHAASGDLAFDLRLVGNVTGPVSDSVLANDTDADGDVLGALLVAAPAHGTLSLSAEGSFVYTPDADFVGVDTFTYRATDGTRQSNVATVTIHVNASSHLAADFNGDGIVNEADLAIVAGGLGMASGADKAAGDANGDGRVDLGDVLALQRAFGEGVASAAPAAVVASRRAGLRADVIGLSPLVAQSDSIRAARRARTAIVPSGDSLVVDTVLSRDDLLRSNAGLRGLRAVRGVSRG